MTTTKTKKSFNTDSKIKIISNFNGVFHWILTTGRPLVFLKPGSPGTIDYMELENMVWTSDYIQTGDIYIPDKEAFDSLGIQNVKWEDIKPLPQLREMLKKLEAEELREEMQKLPEGNKELLAELALEEFDNLKGSVISTIQDESKINIKQIKEDEEANKQNQKNQNKEKK